MKIVRTPPCFSLGMDDWLTDIEYEDDAEAEMPMPLDPNGRKTKRRETEGAPEQTHAEGLSLSRPSPQFQDFEDDFFEEALLLSEDYR